MPPRDGLRERMTGYPAVGAVHPVVSNRALINLLYEEGEGRSISEILDGVFDPPNYFDTRSMEEKDADGVPRYNSEYFYRLFDHQSLGVSVMEMDISAEAAHRQRAVWEGKDLGQVKQEVLDLAARRLPDSRLVLRLSNVIPVGGRLPGKHKEDVRQKLAFLPNIDDEQTQETLQLLFEEHELIIEAIAKRLKSNRRTKLAADFLSYDFVPHVTFLAYKKNTDPGQIIEANKKLNEFVFRNPVTVGLENLTFNRSRLVR